MQLSLVSTADFPAAVAAYSGLVHGADPGPHALELVFAPGTWSGPHLTLKDPLDRGRIALTLRSAGPEPAILTGLGLDLGAERVELRGLVFAGGQGQGYALRVQAREAVVLDRVAFLDRQVLPQRNPGGRARAGVALLAAIGPATRLHVRESWWLGNALPAGQALIELEARPGQGWGEVLVERCAVAGNSGALLSALAPADVLLRDSLLILAPGVEAPAWLPNAAARLRSEGVVQGGDAADSLDALRARARRGEAPDPAALVAEPQG